MRIIKEFELAPPNEHTTIRITPEGETVRLKIMRGGYGQRGEDVRTIELELSEEDARKIAQVLVEQWE